MRTIRAIAAEFAVVSALLLAVAAVQAAGAPLAVQTQRDDFSAYPDGSEAMPAWRTTSPFREIRRGALVSEDAGRVTVHLGLSVSS